MTTADTFYLIGLWLVTLYICVGFDDFIWDIVSLVKRKKLREKKLEIKSLDTIPPKLIALIVAAWKEEAVLSDVIENIIVSQHYPRCMYHIFLGVYPNDEATLRVAEALERAYDNIHCIVNVKPGPTSKAQNINFVLSRINAFEQEKGWKFSAVTIHDSEDLVHPYELKVTNFLIEQHPAIQFPVFPLIRKPTFRNFFQNITTGTYADEFAENHFITMVGRHHNGAFVPSAGTGFSLSRNVVAALGEAVLPENSLTEDYRLSLTLYERGLQMYYLLDKIKRVDDEGKVRWEYIATRSLFPNTFRTAVRQKARWTLGITMQSCRFRDIFQKGLPFAGKYSLFKDQKAKISNLLSLLGYPVLLYFLLSLFLPLPTIFPRFSLSWFLSLLVTAMMLERQLFRAVSLYHVYGLRSVFFGCLFPPLLPLRILWGNLLNLVATIKAYLQFWQNNPRQKKPAETEEEKPPNSVTNSPPTSSEKTKTHPLHEEIERENSKALKHLQQETAAEDSLQDYGRDKSSDTTPPPTKKFVWAKTEHSFLEQATLSRFHRRLGDILVEKNYLSASEVKRLLAQKNEGQLFGLYLVEHRLITESQLMRSLAAIKHVPFLSENTLSYFDLSLPLSASQVDMMSRYMALPLLKTEEGYMVAYCMLSPLNAQSELRLTLGAKKLSTVLTTKETILRGLHMLTNKPSQGPPSAALILYQRQKITAEQLVLLKIHAASGSREEHDLLLQMGLLSQAPSVTADADLST